MGYIKTDKFITDKQLTKAGEIKDAVVNEFCSREILRYSDMINRHEVSNYSVSELIEFLQHSDGDVNFSEFAANFIAQMINGGHARNAKIISLPLIILSDIWERHKLCSAHLPLLF